MVFSSWISEETLTKVKYMTVKSNGGASNPLIASITWIDLPGKQLIMENFRR